MSLLDKLKAEEKKKDKLYHDIILASATLQVNIEKSKEAEDKFVKEAYLNNALIDARFIEKLACLGLKYEK